MNFLRKYFLVFVWAILSFPLKAFGQTTTGSSTGSGGGNGSGGGIGLKNPLSANNIPQILDQIVDFLLIIAAPIAVAMTIWAGYLFLASGGSEDKIKTARRTLLYVVIGVTVLIISKGLVSIVTSLISP